MTSTAYKKALLRKYHTVCHEFGISMEEKEAIKDSYGVKSSRNLTEDQLSQLIDRLESGKDYGKSPTHSHDLWRKRVMAAVGAWLRTINKTDGTDAVKAIACRASGYKSFNSIPISRLRDLYYAFSRKAKTALQTQDVMDEIIDKLEMMN